MKIIATVLFCLLASTASAQNYVVNVTCDAGSTPVSVCNFPNGSGQSLADAGAALQVSIFTASGQPIVGFPAEGIWLQCACGGNFTGCWISGPFADMETNSIGETVFADPLLAGGWCYQEGEPCLEVVIEGQEYPVDDIHLYFNSPDINGDRVVNLTDLGHFVQVLFGEYHYKCDFHWDGVINLADAAIFSQGNGSACP